VPNEAVIGIGIFCSDPRPGANLWKEMKKRLVHVEETIVPLGVLGGPISLANQDDLPTEFNFLMAQIYFALATFPTAKRILVVSHDCGYYNQIRSRTFTLLDKENDLIKVANFLKERFPELVVTTYFWTNKEAGFKKIS
jgi:hypothetical protein